MAETIPAETQEERAHDFSERETFVLVGEGTEYDGEEEFEDDDDIDGEIIDDEDEDDEFPDDDGDDEAFIVDDED